VCAGSLGEAEPEEVVSHVPAQQQALSWNWRLPEAVSAGGMSVAQNGSFTGKSTTV
jgi:hypothetical protein